MTTVTIWRRHGWKEQDRDNDSLFPEHRAMEDLRFATECARDDGPAAWLLEAKIGGN
jgi:hypothetical protein